MAAVGPHNLEASDAKAHVVAFSDCGLSIAEQSLAGVMAKLSVNIALFPLDTWKSRCQARHFGLLHEFSGLWTFSAMFRGFVPKLLSYAPYQAVHMGSYVRFRDHLLASPLGVSRHPAVFACAGVLAELTGSIVRLPTEVAKVRLQLGVYTSTWSALLSFRRRPLTFYAHFVPQTLTHDCVYSACSWMLYESGRQQLFRSRHSDRLQPHEDLLLGSAVGATSALLTNPLDVIKTRIIAPPSNVKVSQGVLETARTILQHEGSRAFLRGALLRIGHAAPAQGMYMCLYEAIKLQIFSIRHCGQ